MLSGPAIRVDPAVATPMKSMIATLLSRILPKAPVSGVDASLVSRNPMVCARYERDSLVCKGGVTARLGAEMILTMTRLLQNASETEGSILLLHGSDDRLTTPDGSVEFYHKCKSKDIQMKMYPQLYHEILNSDEYDMVFADIVEWIEKRLTA